MSDLRRAVETELKFQVATPGAADRLLAADQLGGLVAEAPPRTEQQDDRYLDTADAALARAGFALRIRQHGGQTIVGVKSLRRRGGRAGLHRREELEGPAELGALPRDWPPSPARSLVLELAGDAPLVEVVTIRQLRRKRELRRDDAVVELSLDEVDVIVHGRVVERFEELEAELVTGPEEALDGLLDAFEDTPGLGPVDGSKLERALAAARREGDVSGVLERVIRAAAHDLDVPESAPVEPVPPVADAPAARPGDLPKPGKSPGVAGDDHLSEAGRKVLRHHLALMLAREAGTRSGADPEDLHKMRVATRRQRAAWRVFGSAFDRRATARHEKRLRTVARRLGAVRDLDVLIGGIETYAEEAAADRAALDPLVASWRRQRDAARERLLAELDAPRYVSWLEGYRAFAQEEGAASLPVGAVQPHRVRDTFPSRIWAAYEQVRAYEAVLRWADVTTLHDLRIAGKWLRYTLEFVRDALGPDADPLIARVTALQDHLGLLNDADVAANLARAHLVEHAGALSEAEGAAIGRYLVSREREMARVRRTLPPIWRGVAGLGFRRGLGRVVAGL